MRLAVCAEQWLFAWTLAAAFDRQGHEVVATTDEPMRLLDAALRLHPDLCVVDALDEPTADLGERLHQLQPAPHVVLLADARTERAWDAYDRGFADGVVSKACGLQTLAVAIDSVAGGARVSEGRPATRRQQLVVDALTARELEVLHLVVCGYSTEQMASRLGVSRHTIRTHVQQVLRKLGVHGRGKLARAAADAGLVDVNELTAGGL
jgi:DNA-binding NarL/FixJ family response regulator